MVQFVINLRDKETRRMFKKLRAFSSDFQKDIADSMNEVADGMDKIISSEVTKEFDISRARVQQGIRTKRASISFQKIVTTITGRQIGLRNFNAVDTRSKTFDPSGKGVTFSIKKGRSARLRHAFIAKGNNNNVVVFERNLSSGGTGPTGKRVGRLPLSSKTALSVVGMANSKFDEIEKNVVLKFNKSLASRLA